MILGLAQAGGPGQGFLEQLFVVSKLAAAGASALTNTERGQRHPLLSSKPPRALAFESGEKQKNPTFFAIPPMNNSSADTRKADNSMKLRFVDIAQNREGFFVGFEGL